MTAARRVILIAAAAAVMSYGAVASAKSPEIYPLSKVRRGQKGYGLSTFAGTEPERWEFEVVGVMENFRPKMSIILVKSDDPKLEVTGFWRGMSGSPLFIDGKLACAFSYGFQFNKKAIGGCTPLEFMIEEGLNAPVRAVVSPGGGMPTSARTKKRGSRRAWVSPPRASHRDWLDVAPGGDVNAAFAKLGEARKPWILNAPLPPAPTVAARPDPSDPASMVPAAVPLAMSGLSAPAFEKAKELMAPYPVEPMQAGGTGNRNGGPRAFSLGAPIAVQLVRGDVGFAATGTVSYVRGERVLAFGHPFFEQGEFYAPVTAAEVHTVIPSAISGFVMSSPLRELGSLVQDRLPAIMANTSFRNRMIPMTVSIKAGEGGVAANDTFRAELVNNRFLTPALAGLVAMNAVTRYLPDRDHATVLMKSAVDIKGHGTMHFVDYLYAGDGAASVIGGARGLRVLVPLLFNPYAPVEIERIGIDVELSFDTNYGNIEEVRLRSGTLEPGKRNIADVVLKTYDGKQYVEHIPFDVPAHLAGSIVKLIVEPGDAATLDIAPPESLDDLIAAFQQLLPGNIFTVTLYTAEAGIAIDGKLVRDLPASALDRLNIESGTQRASAYKAISRSSAPSKRVLNGAKSLLVRVADK